MRKLLKYDLRSMRTIFLIASASLLIFALFGTACMKITTHYRYAVKYSAQIGLLSTFAEIGIGLTTVAFCAYITFMFILILRRFYTHLYTDQGYLTFTLPVKRREIFASKLVFGEIYMLAAEAVAAVGILIISLFGKYGTFINADVVKGISEFFSDGFDMFGGFWLQYIAEVFIIFVLMNALAILIGYSCISVGALLVKKYKVLMGIGVYYALNSIGAPILWIILIALVDSSLWQRMDLLTETMQKGVVSMMFVLVIICLLGLCSVLCGLNTYLTRKKINIA